MMKRQSPHRYRRLARTLIGVVGLLAVVVAMSACVPGFVAGNCTQKGATSGTAATTVKLVADSQTIGAYQPKDVSVKAGESVTWDFQDTSNPHSVTADNGSFDSCLHDAGYTFTTTFSKPGTYTYYCSIHRQMTGRVTVT
jgi:plastocyanin